MLQLADIPEGMIAGFCLFLLKENGFEGVIETVLSPYLQNRYSCGKNQCVCSFVKMNLCCFEPPFFLCDRTVGMLPASLMSHGTETITAGFCFPW